MNFDLDELRGRTALVTGANSGLGYETALELARHGVDVSLACRNIVAGQAAVDRIRATGISGSARAVQLDLASLQSVADCAQAWTRPLHLLINNAGVMAPPTWRVTSDGFELQFGTNHLGHFALTGRLLPALLAAGDARVVTVSSIAHRSGTAAGVLSNADPGSVAYDPMGFYANSKLANLLFALELQRRAAGSGVTSTAAHPGVSATNLFRSADGMGTSRMIRSVGAVLSKVALQSAHAGALPVLYAAGAAEPGSYTGPRFLEVRGGPSPARISSTASDASLAAQLWAMSEELTGVHYEWPGDR